MSTCRSVSGLQRLGQRKPLPHRLIVHMRQILDPSGELARDGRPNDLRELIHDADLVVKHHRADLNDLVDKAAGPSVVACIPLQIDDNI